MEITRGQTINPAFTDALAKLGNLKFDMKTAVNIIKTIKVITEELKVTHEVKNTLLNTYGVKQVGTAGIEFENPKFEETFEEEVFFEKLNELFAQKVEIPLEAKITLPEDAIISPATIGILEDIISF